MNGEDTGPGAPLSPSPPSDLLKLADSLSHPLVVQSGITTTPNGRWALLVRVRSGVAIPLCEVDQAAGEHPVVYQQAPDSPQVARPAFPARGE